MSNVLEFILRMRDEASAKIRAVREQLRAAKDTADTTKPGFEGLSGTLKGFSESFNRARNAIMETVGVLGFAYAAFRVAYSTFRPLGESLREVWDPVAKGAAMWKTIAEQTAATAKLLAAYETETKERIDEIADGYERQARAAQAAARQEEALAAARQKGASARQGMRATQIDADERTALSQGYDPAAVRLLYADERRRAAAEAGVETAEAEAAQARRALEAAEQARALAVNRSIAMQSEVIAAEQAKAAARRLLAESESDLLTAEQQQAKRQKALIADRQADVALRLAQRGAGEASEGEAAADDAAAVARASAAAAEEGMRAAALKRADAEHQYQAELREFWAERDEAERQAQAEALDAVRAQMEERRQLAERQAREEHERRLEDIRAEASASEQAQASAQSRLDRARAAASQAWGWYRDPEAFRRQLAEEKADAAAQQQFQRDAASLQRRSNWRTRELDAGDEAVRRVIVAREEEQRAARALEQIEKNTAQLDTMLRQLLTSK